MAMTSEQIKRLYQLGKQGKLTKEQASQHRYLQAESASKQGLTDTSDILSRVITYLKEQTAEVLKLNTEKIEIDASLEEYGLDSVMAMEMTDHLNKDFEKLPKTLLFEYPTIRKLTEYLINHQQKGVDRLTAKSESLDFSMTSATNPIATQLQDSPAHFNDTQSKQKLTFHDHGEEMEFAIIGVSGTYPQADDLHEFWENLKAGKDCITDVPESRWNHESYYDKMRNKPGTTYCRVGGFINGVDEFDPEFFKITPREAKFMDPQERLFLQCVYHTLEDAGYTARSLAKDGDAARVGVYVGVMYEEYQLYAAQEAMLGKNYQVSASPSSVANRVSYYFNFDGPSLSVDTMCSSSLTAVHLACKSIENGDCELAIAGGVNVTLHPNKYLLLSQANFLSESGRCASFSDAGDGYVPGEGVGAILIKAKKQAIADRDHIYAIIKGTSINHGGRAKNFTVPNSIAQTKVVAEAIRKARINPRMISYVEAHGTGTALGDPIEISGLNRVFSSASTDRNYCAIGSVKSNIGHCESAAGIAGLTKVLLQMKHKILVPSIHTAVLNTDIDFLNSPFSVQRIASVWEKARLSDDGEQAMEYPRIAGISSFGAGGANAHVILEEYDIAEQCSKSTNDLNHVVLLSSSTHSQLKEQAEKMLAHLQREIFEDCDLEGIAYTTQVGREHFGERVALNAGSLADLKTMLDQFLSGIQANSLHMGSVSDQNRVLDSKSAGSRTGVLMNQWLRNRSLDNLADLWVQGGNVDWAKLYAEQLPIKISLPGYSFKRIKCWSPSLFLGNQTLMSDPSPKHPLLHVDLSSPDQIKFASLFTGSESFLADHEIHKQRILPGAAYLEMIRHAVEITDKEPEQWEIQNLKWLRPLLIGNVPSNLSLELMSSKDDSMEIRFQEEQGTNQVVLCTGKVSKFSQQPLTFPDLAVIRHTAASFVEVQDIYSTFEKMGFHYGHSHQAIQKIWSGNKCALAFLENPSRKAEVGSQWQLAIIDGAFQACMGLYVDEIVSGSASTALVPFSVDTIQPLGLLEDRCWVYIEYAADDSPDLRKQNIYIYNEKGELSLYFKGFSIRALKKSSTTSPQKEQHDDQVLLLRPIWHRIQTNSFASAKESRPCYIVTEMTPPSKESYHRHFKLSVTEVSYGEKYINYATQLLGYIQQAIKEAEGAAIFFQVVLPWSPGIEGLAGLLKTAKLEHSSFQGQLVVTDHSEAIGNLVAVAMSNSSKELIVCRERAIYYESYEQIFAPTQASTGVTFRDGGVYVLTGGIGGLSRLMARYIAEQATEAKIILLGRTPENAEIRQWLASLAVQQSQVTYYSLDISDEYAVKALFNELILRYKTINGIVHNAGIIDDKLLIRKTANDIRKVLLPKVIGLQNIDEASRTIPLDWLVLSSSVSGTTGNFGQADYAAANAYMDNFADHRNRMTALQKRNGITFSINWPFWLDGGMGMSAERQSALKQQMGIAALTTTVGLQVWASIMSAAYTRVTVLYGDTAKIKRAFHMEEQQDRTVIHEDQNSKKFNVDVLQTKLISYLRFQLTQFLEMESLVEAAVSFETLGMDSVLLMQFQSELETKFPGLPKTLLYEYGNLTDLAGYIFEEQQPRLPEILGVSPAVAETVLPLSLAKDENPNDHNMQTGTCNREGADVDAQLSAMPADVFSLNPQAGMGEIAPVSNSDNDIAIIALAGQYPGARNIETFWDNLKTGSKAITQIPQERWRMKVDNPDFGGFIQDIDQFDPLFFNLSPKEAAVMDPQCRLLLETTWHLLENGGYATDRISQEVRNKVGVFVGVMSNQYAFLDAPAEVQDVQTTYAFHSIANRISHFFDFQGPSFAIDAACSSSLTALHLACRSLADKECNMAVVGGANLSIHPGKYRGLDTLGLLGQDQNAVGFGDGSGYLPSEGIGAVLLKRLSDAEQAGDHIVAVIKSTHINHAGKANGYAMPNPNQQAALMVENFKKSKIDPSSISYAELAVSGSAISDAIEVAGIKKAFAQFTTAQGFCAVGSVKSNLGHGEAVSGLAQISKVALQLFHKLLVPIAQPDKRNPYFSLDGSPFYYQDSLEHWQLRSPAGHTFQSRRAAVSSFGAGGTYVHVVLEEYVPGYVPQLPISTQPSIIPISARTEPELRAVASGLLSYISENKEILHISSVAKALQRGRMPMKYRAAFVASNFDEMIQRLQEISGTDLQKSTSRSPKNYVISEDDSASAGFENLYDCAEWQLFLQALIENRRYEQLAWLWVQGRFNEWGALYNDIALPWPPLPNYPFSRQRCWVNDGTALAADPEAPVIDPIVPHAVPPNDMPNSTEGMLRDILQKHLGLEPHHYSIDDSFHDIGLNSMMRRDMGEHLTNCLNLKITSRDLLEYDTVSRLAAWIDNQSKEPALSDEKDVLPKVAHLEIPQRVSLTEGQKGLWLLQQADPNSNVYNVPIALKLAVTAEVNVIEQACRYLLYKHPLLNAAISSDHGDPYFYFPEIATRISNISVGQDTDIIQYLRKLAKQPFDMDNGLTRIQIVHHENGNSYLLMTIHHVIFDGASAEVLSESFAEGIQMVLENGSASAPSTIDLTFKEQVQLENELLCGERETGLRQFWAETLSGQLPILELPTDKPRINAEPVAGQILRFTLDKEISAAVKAYAAASRVSLTALFLGIYKVLVNRYTNESDIVIGMPVALRNNRTSRHAVGYFVNMVPVRSHINSEDSLEQFIRQLQFTLADAMDNATYPFPLIVRNLGISHTTKSPVYQLAFAYQNFMSGSDRKASSADGVSDFETITNIRQEGEYELLLEVYESEYGFDLLFNYNANLYEEETIGRMFLQLKEILKQLNIASNSKLGSYPILPADEYQKVVHEWNATLAPYNEHVLLHHGFEFQADKDPQAIALLFNDDSICYGDLEVKANQLANYLKDVKAVGPGCRVAIGMRRSFEMIISLLAILKCGATYVPLDPDHPIERLRQICNDADMTLLISRGDLTSYFSSLSIPVLDADKEGEAISQTVKDRPNIYVPSTSLAYIIYTSGSTGAPKGVEIAHYSVANLFEWIQKEFAIGKTDRGLFVSSLSFDLSVYDIFGLLAAGASIHIVGEDKLKDAEWLAQMLVRHPITFWDSAPALLKQVEPFFESLAGKSGTDFLRLVFLSGDWIPLSLPPAIRQCFPNAEVISLGGATEATVWSNFYRIGHMNPDWLSIPYGKPIQNSFYYVLDQQLSPCPIGVPGNLYIGGVCVAQGYTDPVLTASRFINNPFRSGDRLYFTGDRARFRQDGNIEFLGRIDFQVKLRGYRIELGEIEAVVSKHPAVKDAVALVREDDPGTQLLVVYVLLEKGAEANVAELKSRAAEKLPSYMVPSAIVILDSFPVTSNGKMDRKALPPPTYGNFLTHEFIAPRTETEKLLASIWIEVLNLDQVGIEDNLFDIGGDSLSAMQIVAKAKAAGFQLSIRQLFENLTIAALAALDGQALDIVADQEMIIGDVPLTPIQKWFFQERFEFPLPWDQKVILHVPKELNIAVLKAALERVIEHHDLLRASFVISDQQDVRQTIGLDANFRLVRRKSNAVTSKELLAESETILREVNSADQIQGGELINLVHLETGGPSHDWLIISIHHLLVDAVSWTVLIDDLKRCYSLLLMDSQPDLPLKTTSYQYWSERLAQWSHDSAVKAETIYWQSILNKNDYRSLTDKKSELPNLERDKGTIVFDLDASVNGQKVFEALATSLDCKIDDIFLASLGMALGEWQAVDQGRWLLMSEGHGREALFEEVDLSRTVGWFTCLSPLPILHDTQYDIPAKIAQVRDEKNKRAFNGINFGLLAYHQPDADLLALLNECPIEISFNFLGRAASITEPTDFSLLAEGFGVNRSSLSHRPFLVEIDIVQSSGSFVVFIHYSNNSNTTATMQKFSTAWQQAISKVVSFYTGQTISNGRDEDEKDSITGEIGENHILAPENNHSLNVSTEKVLPLTHLQVAYKIGESPFFTLDGIVAHEYIEVEYQTLNLDKYVSAWRELVSRHPILRCEVSEDHQLKLLSNTPDFQPEIVLYDRLDENGRVQQLQNYRNDLQQKGPSTEHWPLLQLTLHLYAKDRIIVHLNVPIIIMDGLSLRKLFADLTDIYLNESTPWSQPGISLQDYYQGLLDIKQSKEYLVAKLYWKKRVLTMPNPPELPLNKKLEDLGMSNLEVMGQKLDQAAWTKIKQYAQRFHLTPSAVLLTSFAKVLSKWSNNHHFVFSLLNGNRLPLHPDVNDLMGNFSSTSIFEADFHTAEPFVDLVRRFQGRLQKDLEHFHYNGVEVITDMNMQRKHLHGGIPIAFSDTTVFPVHERASGLKEKVNLSGAQTPHVYLDCVIHNIDGGINLRWSYQHNAFPKGTIAAMLQYNIQILEALASHVDQWEKVLDLPLPFSELSARLQANMTDSELPQRQLLHTLFLQSAERFPQHPAIKSSEGVFSYSELRAFSNCIANRLYSLGCKPNELVAVVMHKGWEQVAAVLAISIAGSAYMPVDASLPPDRINKLLQLGKVSVVLTQDHLLNAFDWAEDLAVLPVNTELYDVDDTTISNSGASASDLAYVIFTSGSTGEPKGVMITHESAINTLIDINSRFDVSSSDKVLAISSLSFDLSVYDVFGILAAGGTIVIPNENDHLDPKALVKWIKEEQITIWNSVPAFLQMIGDFLEDNASDLLQSLRLIMMSGDWIPTDLPARLNKIAPQCLIYSLGGATEVSIWSIIYHIEHVDSAWKSIPYGKPMRNQTFEILDENLQPVPQWVPGDIYIGGFGLAKGYWMDEQRTRESFIEHPADARMLYKTGDLGRYLPDGNIEFLGRSDNQIKINGFRVELGEIEAVLKQHAAVKDGLVDMRKSPTGEKFLVAYIITKDFFDEESLQSLKTFLRAHLPSYMMPKQVVKIPEIPKSKNGKVNRKALPLPGLDKEEKQFVPPSNQVEEKIAGLLKSILNINLLSVHDSFFDLGGHSISAVRFISSLNKAFDKELPISILNEYGSVRLLGELLTENNAPTLSSLVEMNAGNGENPFFCIHPVGGHILTYQELAKHFPERPFVGVQSPEIIGQTFNFESVNQLAIHYLGFIRRRQPQGPYFIGGWSFGGIVAYEMAKLLELEGECVSQVVLIDSYLPEGYCSEMLDDKQLLTSFIDDLTARNGVKANSDFFREEISREDLPALISKLKTISIIPTESQDSEIQLLFNVYQKNMQALGKYVTPCLQSPVHLIKAMYVDSPIFDQNKYKGLAALGWEQFANVKVTLISGDHYSIFYSAQAGSLAEIIQNGILALQSNG